MSSKVRLRDAYSIPTVSYVHHFPVSAGVWSRPDTRGVITSATTRYERMSDKVNLRGSACTIAGTPGRKQDMVRHLRITNFRYVYCSLPHSCSRAHTRGTKTLFLTEVLGLTPSPRRRFQLLSSRHYRLKTFAKRIFPRCRALLSGRDVTRVRHDAMGVASWRAGSSLPLRYRNGLSGRERRLIKPPRPV